MWNHPSPTKSSWQSLWCSWSQNEKMFSFIWEKPIYHSDSECCIFYRKFWNGEKRGLGHHVPVSLKKVPRHIFPSHLTPLPTGYCVLSPAPQLVISFSKPWLQALNWASLSSFLMLSSSELLPVSNSYHHLMLSSSSVRMILFVFSKQKIFLLPWPSSINAKRGLLKQ